MRTLFITDSGLIGVGIAALILNFKKLRNMMGSMAVKAWSFVAALDEIFSLFTKGRTGLLEKAWFGGDIDPEKEFKTLFKVLDILGMRDMGSIGSIVAAVLTLKAVIWAFSKIAGKLIKTLGKAVGIGATKVSKGGSTGFKGANSRTSFGTSAPRPTKFVDTKIGRFLLKTATKIGTSIIKPLLGRNGLILTAGATLGYGGYKLHEKMTEDKPEVFNKTVPMHNGKPTNTPATKVEAHFHGVAPNTSQEIKEKMDEIFMMNSVGGYD